MSRALSRILPFLALSGMDIVPTRQKSESEYKADLDAIIAEFNLINQKASKLPRKNRELVVARVHQLNKQNVVEINEEGFAKIRVKG